MIAVGMVDYLDCMIRMIRIFGRLIGKLRCRFGSARIVENVTLDVSISTLYAALRFILPFPSLITQIVSTAMITKNEKTRLPPNTRL